MPRGQRSPTTWWRCPRCDSLVPTKYLTCGTCGSGRNDKERELIAYAKRIFPGSREL